jgi:hypothetical protein
VHPASHTIHAQPVFLLVFFYVNSTQLTMPQICWYNEAAYTFIMSDDIKGARPRALNLCRSGELRFFRRFDRKSHIDVGEDNGDNRRSTMAARPLYKSDYFGSFQLTRSFTCVADLSAVASYLPWKIRSVPPVTKYYNSA